MRTCTVCAHPKRGEIDRALIGRESSYRNIAERFGVSVGALSRHKAGHLFRLVQEAEESRELELRGELLDQVETLKSRAERILNATEQAGSYPTALSAIREARSCIELLLDLRLEEELQAVREEIAEVRRGRA